MLRFCELPIHPIEDLALILVLNFSFRSKYKKNYHWSNLILEHFIQKKVKVLLIYFTLSFFKA